MKMWKKIKQSETGETLLIWRSKSVNRFLLKILTWLLGSFVCGILTAIVLAPIINPDTAQNAARFVFFIVLIFGNINSFFNNVIHGLEFRITSKGLVGVKPFCGIEVISKNIGLDKVSFLNKNEFIPWSSFKEIETSDNAFAGILHDDKGSVVLEASHIEFPKNLSNPQSSVVISTIVQKAKEAKKNQ